jgi:beta-glucanase (GH16 family)
MTSSALHYGGPSDIYQSSSNVFRDGSTISEYHTYGVIWNERDISFYCDDNVYLEISLDSKNASKHWFSGENENELAPFDQDFYLLFNLAVGGNFDGNIVPEEDFNECEMKVDYIRIYQKI